MKNNLLTMYFFMTTLGSLSEGLVGFVKVTVSFTIALFFFFVAMSSMALMSMGGDTDES